MSITVPATGNLTTIGDLHAWLLRAAVERSDAVQEYRDFYAGKQPDALTDTMRTVLAGLLEAITPATADDFDPTVNGSGGSDYLCDNACRPIIDTPRARLLVTGRECEDEAVLKAIEDVWLLNRLDEQMHDVHRDALRDGTTYVLLGWDNDKRRVVVDHEMAWVADGENAQFGTGVHITYDSTGQPTVAIKEWLDESVGKNGQIITLRRRNLYYPDRIERYAIDLSSTGGAQAGQEWQKWVLPDELTWPAPWIDPKTNEPLGLPVVPFRNEPDAQHYGVSDLSGSIIGLQRAYNDALHNLLAAGRLTAFQMFFASGVSKGETDDWKAGPARIWGSQAIDAKVTPLAVGDLQPLMDEAMHILKSISHNSDLPMHAFTGEWPSGEALMRSETGLTSKVRLRQARFGPAWASVLHKATILVNAFGGLALNVDEPISVRWEAPELRDERWTVDLVNAKSNVLSTEQMLREMNYKEEQIVNIMKERQAAAEQAAALEASTQPAVSK